MQEVTTKKIEAKLVVAEELFYAKAGHGSIEHREIDARKEAEERTDIFLCRGAEGGNGSALRGETSCGRTGEGVVDGIQTSSYRIVYKKGSRRWSARHRPPKSGGSRAELGVELGDDPDLWPRQQDARRPTDKRGAGWLS